MRQPKRAAGLLGLAAGSLTPALGLASQGPGVSQGTAGQFAQTSAAAMVLFPIVAVVVFAVARLAFGRS